MTMKNTRAIAYEEMIFSHVWRRYKSARFPRDKIQYREHCREIVKELRKLKKD